MQLKEQAQSALRMKNIFFQEVHMETSGKRAADTNDVQVGFRIEEPNISAKSLRVGLHCRVEIKNVMSLHLLLVGIFQADDEEFLQRMVPNAIAIIFPYMRSQVTLMTAQPNLPPIVLPPININALLKTEMKNNGEMNIIP